MRIPHMLASWLTGLAIASTATAQTLPTTIPTESAPTTIEVAPPAAAFPTIPLFEPTTTLLPVSEQPKPKDDKPKDDKPKSPFAKMPPLQKVAPPAALPIAPTEEGYYTFLDLLEGNKTKAPKSPYPRFALVPFGMENFDYRPLDKVDDDDKDFWERLKRIPVGENWMFSTGGEFRWRYANETNSRLTGKTNNYDLYRTRLYTDLYYQDRFRFFLEGYYAESINQNLPPLGTDIDRGDIHQGFFDLRLFDFGEDNRVWVRGGRQELIYGSQRLVSPSEWGNVRRAYDGVKVYERSEKWDLDAWVVQPVIPTANKLDSVDHNVVFSGIWSTYRPDKGKFLDLYYMNLDNTNATFTGSNGVKGGYNVSTFGFRALDVADFFLYDVEAALQSGKYVNQDIFAGMFTSGVGYHAKNMPWNPQFWLFYDYASGDKSPNAGDRNTFNQLFAFGHYYMGLIDAVGRQNIHDINGQINLYPSEWVTTQLQYHHFQLDQAKDALYGPGGNVVRQDKTGRSGNNVGQEIDFITNLHLTKHQDFLMGYSHLFPGSYIRNTGSGVGLDTVYLQYNYRW